MQEIINFLNKYRSGALATVEDGMPRVRPWALMFENNGKFWFMTNNQKKVFQQLQKNPYIEFCASSPDYIHVRLTGKIEFYDDINIKQQIFETYPLLKNIYQTYDNPILELFYLEHGTAAINFYHKGEVRFYTF